MSDQPHVILLMGDHLRRDCLTVYGQLNVDTPNLDALAAESVVFDRVYCATPLCTPTRSSMYTGKTPHTHGAIVNGHSAESADRCYGVVGPEHRTLYECLDAAGYGITQIGVQHCQTEPALQQRVPGAELLGHAEHGDYAASKGIEGSAWSRVDALPNVEWEGERPVVSMRARPEKFLFPGGAEEYLDSYWSRVAVDRIKHIDWSQPRYFESLFWAPHPPLEVPVPYYNMYPEDSIKLPEAVGRWYPGQPASLVYQSCGQMGSKTHREEYREAWSAYFGLVTLLDDCLGRVIGALKDRGVWDDALVVFTQDHGDMMGCHHLMQKHCMYEEATHLPLLVKPPASWGVVPGRRDALVGAADYCPSICTVAGAEPPEGVEGVSWVPIVRGDAWNRDAIFMEYNGDQGRSPWPMRCVVADLDGRTWKYIRTKGDVDELYDLTEDPSETQSLVEDAASAAVRSELRARLEAWMDDTGDFEDMDAAPQTWAQVEGRK